MGVKKEEWEKEHRGPYRHFFPTSSPDCMEFHTARQWQ